MSIKKWNQYNESYQVNSDEHLSESDLVKEYAKEVISYYIENKLDGVTLKKSFERLVENYGLNSMSGTKELIKDTIEKFASQLQFASSKL